MSLFGSKPKPQAQVPPSPKAERGMIETVIGPNCNVNGQIQSDGGIRIDGVFQGTVETTSNLIIGESAKVVADITANNVSISGAVKGDISANKVEILETGRVWGDLLVNSLLLNEGAYLRGQTMMHGDIEPPLIEPPKGSMATRPTSAPPPAQAPQPPRPEPIVGDIVDIEPE